LRFSQRLVAVYVVPDVSGEREAVLFKGKQSMKNIGNHLPKDGVTFQKTRVLLSCELTASEILV
jgi:hypothetical protein